MAKLWAFLILGLIASQTTCMNIREKRQSGNDNRYAFNYPNNGIDRPDRFPIQNTFPGQNPFYTDIDFIISFPNQIIGQGQLPNQSPVPVQGYFPKSQTSITTNAPINDGVISASVQQCIDNCINCCITPEFNPVCGSDDVTYQNPGRLSCAKNCGVNVILARQSAC